MSGPDAGGVLDTVERTEFEVLPNKKVACTLKLRDGTEITCSVDPAEGEQFDEGKAKAKAFDGAVDTLREHLATTSKPGA